MPRLPPDKAMLRHVTKCEFVLESLSVAKTKSANGATLRNVENGCGFGVGVS